jgi:hypothetical protein
LVTIQALEACGVDLYLDQQAIDTTKPAGRLMFQITGAFAETARSLNRLSLTATVRKSTFGERSAARCGASHSPSCSGLRWAVSGQDLRVLR